jgi:hypothetical protein
MAALVLGMAGPRAAAAAPTSMTVADFDFVDTSGEPQNEVAAHATRMAAFTQYLRDAVAKSGKTTLVKLPCAPEKCSADSLQADDLMEAAKRSKADLLVFGGVHKISTLIEFASIEVADVKTGKSVLHRSVTFRGDSDQAWQRAAEFCATMVLEGR